jgi:N-ethylmaleimide reductase
MGNCGYTNETTEEAIQSRRTDLISFCRPFISNPGLADRMANGWLLNPTADMKGWYSFEEVGYTDFPRYETRK